MATNINIIGIQLKSLLGMLLFQLKKAKIYYAQNLIFLTRIDAYSKFLVVKEIQNKLNIENKVMELLQHFPHAKVIMTDNELYISPTPDSVPRTDK